ncbi:putative MFS family arabinose efflux permease [Murinocardiopsis flavida]|uniref:Putative MFS family arabinose efflux permease n=1 Tax=Murinocardiopsis flavida TaxID=645275 RepID=A0A2P8CUY1_9ACTN|nr:MFS transporter [Murinocardiopsis flavida]PSK88749.1 putative MFS family arabinose efflux permease [Murinocardiopsis flavida]
MGNPRTDNQTFGIPRQGSETGAPGPQNASAGACGSDDTGPSAAGPDDGSAPGAPPTSSDPPSPAPPGHPPEPDWRRSYGEVMRIREFQALWLSHALSMTGNFVLSIAVTALVYQQTSSALASGFTMALTFIPQIIGGPLLSGLADLFPRRRVIIVSEITRAVLVASIGIPGLPLWAVWVLVFASILPLVPFSAARAALMAEIVQGDRYIAGSAIINLTSQAGTLVGLIVGGVVASAIGSHLAVMFNGLTFLLAAAIIAVGIRARPAPHHTEAARPSLWTITRDGTRLVFNDRRLRTLGLFAWLAGFYMIPSGIANPMAAESGGGAAAAGLIMAGPAMGAIVGGLVLTRMVNPDTRMRLIGPLAVFSSVPLLLWVVELPLWLMVALLAVGGAAASYQFVANAAFVLCVPPEGRGLAFGLVAAGLQAVQGIGIGVSSLLTEVVGIQAVVVAAGLLGVVCAVVLTASWLRIAPEVASSVRGSESPAA